MACRILVLAVFGSLIASCGLAQGTNAAAAPAWARTLSEVEILGDEDYRLFLGALPFPLIVRRGTFANG